MVVVGPFSGVLLCLAFSNGAYSRILPDVHFLLGNFLKVNAFPSLRIVGCIFLPICFAFVVGPLVFLVVFSGIFAVRILDFRGVYGLFCALSESYALSFAPFFLFFLFLPVEK